MNLTKLFAAGLCFIAMTASAAYVKTNAFEGEATVDWWVGDGQNLTTRSVANDTTNNRASYSGNRPLPDAANTQVLKLDTGTEVWTNTIQGASFLEVDIYADMLVKFVPSDDLPTLTIEDSAKLALAIKANGGGTNYLQVANHSPVSFNWTNTVQEISTSQWYRVTVKMYVSGEQTFADIYVNGTTIEGSPFEMNADTDLTAISFQGTGYIDEVVVRSDNPFGAGALLTLQFSTGISSVYVGAFPKVSGQTVTSGQQLSITTSNFYEIASVTGVGTSWSVGGLTETSGVVTVTSATDATVTITAQAETGVTPYADSGSFTNAPGNKVATWAINNGVSELTEGIYEQYLLNIDDQATLPDLLIKSVAVTNTTVTVTVEATGVNFGTINGTLKLLAYPVLGGTPETFSTGFSGTTTATVQTDIGTNKFVKALVE